MGTPKIYGLLGRRLGHSSSPEIHHALGNGEYRLYELEPEELGAFLQHTDIGGLNITIPYKRDVMRWCTSLSGRARAIGSVNTIVRRPDGGLHGDNTDLFGLQYMAARAGISFRGRKALIFGSGGASLTAQTAAREGGAAGVVVISRNGPDNYENLSHHADAEILLNATPVGMYPEVHGAVANIASFPRCIGVLDMVYNPHRTEFIMGAQAANIPCSDGLPMLVAQAKAAHELFFDVKVPDERVEEILHTLRRDMENIVLIGMPGSGKNTVGLALAHLTGREIVDTDACVAACAGMEIPEIFARFGEAHFRALERKAVEAAGLCRGKIIVTGGGVVKEELNGRALHRNGRVYCIKRDVELLARSGRPLSAAADLCEMERERTPLYASFSDADVRNDGTPEQTAACIWKDFCDMV